MRLCDALVGEGRVELTLQAMFDVPHRLTVPSEQQTLRHYAVEPSERMLDVLRSTLPGVEALVGTAERIPLVDASVQVVTVAQAFHWFDRGPACAEISRVLVPGGTLGLLWNRADPECAWDRDCHRIAHPAAADASTDNADEELPGFELVLRTQLRWTEPISRDLYLRRWTTVSSVAHRR